MQRASSTLISVLSTVFSLILVSQFLSGLLRMQSSVSYYSVSSFDSVSPAECGYSSTSQNKSLRKVSWVFVALAVFEIELIVFLFALLYGAYGTLILLLLLYGLFEIVVAGK